MKQISSICGLLALILITASSHAQSDNSFKMALNLGTQGIGLDLIQSAGDHLDIRVGGSVLPNFSVSAKQVTFGDFSGDTKITTKNFTNLHALADYYISSNSGFRITPGFAYFLSSTAKTTITPVGTYKLNDLVLTPEVVGSASGSIRWSGFAPYLGMGYQFGRSGDGPISLGIDLGCYYLPKPYGVINGTGLFSNNSLNSPQFNTNVSGYRYMPNLQLNLIYKL